MSEGRSCKARGQADGGLLVERRQPFPNGVLREFGDTPGPELVHDVLAVRIHRRRTDMEAFRDFLPQSEIRLS